MNYSKNHLLTGFIISVICVSGFLYGCVKAISQNTNRQTYYYALTKKIDLDEVFTNTAGGQFITFEGNTCYDSDKNGVSVGNGILTYSQTVDGVEIFKGKSYFSKNTQYKFAKGRTVLNVVVGDGRIYVYKRCQAPKGSITCSLIKKPSGSSQPTQPAQQYPGGNGGYAGYPSQGGNGNSGSSNGNSSSSSSPQKQWKTVYYEETCPRCYGSGKCPTCNGKGWFYGSFGTGEQPCPNCESNHNGRCAHCHGTGKVTKSKQVFE